MKRILLVDDEPLILKLYREGLEREGFQVEVAADGLAALTTLRQRQPDLIVLDLMMPRFTGVDVLKFVRGNPSLLSLPVIVLSNSYMNALALEAREIGVQAALLKVSSSPSILAEFIRNLLEGSPLSLDSSKLLAVPMSAKQEGQDSTGPAPLATGQPPASAAVSATQPLADPSTKSVQDLRTRTRRDFLASATATRAELDRLWQALRTAHNDSEREIQLDNLYRKVQFVAASAGLAQCTSVAMLGTALEAMLFEVVHQPSLLSLSAMRTVAMAIEFLGLLLEQYPGHGTEFAVGGNVLVVDDDAVTNRLLVAALARAHLQARSTQSPLHALQMLQETHYDLLLLDIEMPEMSGLDLCKRARALPEYKRAPIVIVTRHSDFESRAEAARSGGTDFISKPFFALELAVKAVTHLLRSRLEVDAPSL